MNTDTDTPPYVNPTPQYKARVRELNDQLRTTMSGEHGQVMMSTQVFAMPDTDRAKLIRRVRAFCAFDTDNDPHEEHDFGMINLADDVNTASSYDSEQRYSTQYCWKIDYYNTNLSMHSHDPSNPEITRRVLTLMHISDN